MSDETYDIQLDTVGAEAVQQTLDALGAKAETVNAKAETGSPPFGQSAGAPDLSALLAGQAETNALLARIAAALERQSSNNLATY